MIKLKYNLVIKLKTKYNLVIKLKYNLVETPHKLQAYGLKALQQ